MLDTTGGKKVKPVDYDGLLKYGWGLSLRAIMRSPKLDVYAKAVYSYLSSLAGDKSVCYPSQDLISEELGISKPTIVRALKRLEELGLIRKELLYGNGPRRNLKYILIITEDTVENLYDNGNVPWFNHEQDQNDLQTTQDSTPEG